jgi:undecaprenyl pyrophosphate synthase
MKATVTALSTAEIQRSADELEHILTAALARLDQRGIHHRIEETTMGHCWEAA